MRIYLRKNPAKFHPDPIWNEGTYAYFKEVTFNKINKMSSAMRSVPDSQKHWRVGTKIYVNI